MLNPRKRKRAEISAIDDDAGDAALTQSKITRR
jgi:hypothetical protein